MGFSTVFILLGVAASAVGGLLYDLSTWLSKIGGIVVIMFGLHMTGIFRIRFLEYDLRPQATPDRKWGYFSSFLMGVFFSAGWSPCVGPILGAILTLSLNEGSISQGAILLTAYSLGLAIPFLVAAIEIGLVTQAIQRYGKVMHYVEVVMGVILIIVGVMLFFGRFEGLARFGNFFGAIDELNVGRIVLGIIILSILLGLLPAVIASRKGRNFYDWWIFGTGLILFALPASLLIKPAPKQEPAQLEAEESS
jgi:cytochrome c-type biogenesis protein